MKKQLKKGFTLTELVIVIVIIAILAAVLIPSMTGYVNRAKKSNATQEAATMYNVYAAWLVDETDKYGYDADKVTIAYSKAAVQGDPVSSYFLVTKATSFTIDAVYYTLASGTYTKDETVTAGSDFSTTDYYTFASATGYAQSSTKYYETTDSGATYQEKTGLTYAADAVVTINKTSTAIEAKEGNLYQFAAYVCEAQDVNIKAVDSTSNAVTLSNKQVLTSISTEGFTMKSSGGYTVVVTVTDGVPSYEVE